MTLIPWKCDWICDLPDVFWKAPFQQVFIWRDRELLHVYLAYIHCTNTCSQWEVEWLDECIICTVLDSTQDFTEQCLSWHITPTVRLVQVHLQPIQCDPLHYMEDTFRCAYNSLSCLSSPIYRTAGGETTVGERMIGIYTWCTCGLITRVLYNIMWNLCAPSWTTLAAINHLVRGYVRRKITDRIRPVWAYEIPSELGHLCQFNKQATFAAPNAMSVVWELTEAHTIKVLSWPTIHIHAIGLDLWPHLKSRHVQYTYIYNRENLVGK